MIYLDNAAAAPVIPEVREFYSAAIAEDFANQEAIHLLAYRTRKKLELCADELVSALTVSGNWQVIWGNSATELFQLLGTYLTGRKTVSSVLEHPALKANLKQTDPFELKCDSSAQLIRAEPPFTPSAVCIHQIQSELGAIQDTAALFRAYPGTLRIVDAVQAAGKFLLPAEADVLVISGVKFGAPGGAALLVNNECREAANIIKFSAVYRNQLYRMSRIQPALIRTLAFTADFAAKRMDAEFSRISEINRRLKTKCRELGILPTLPDSAPVSPYILNLDLDGKQSAVIVRALSELDIFAASGSACSAESDTPSPAMLAIGRKKAQAYSALRISFGTSTTVEDADFFASSLKTVLKNY